ncbi:diguanylate cyclase [Mangrovitalea sediminis]|uniref:diguanylate cyclase n=1 Tax=Mangrovitalea sediminis TaxID=1982043 RepID=UPI000BE623E5|nr:diguanylate cyclase [Mangrovitalea sediminis]
MNQKILLIEDSHLITKVLRHVIRTQVDLPCDNVMTLAETRKRLEADPGGYFAAVVDLNLPDAPNGEVLDYVLSHKIPCIVLTATFDEGKRETILQKPIVDYVVKESRHSYEYVARLLRRIVRNRDIKVLVADDSETSRAYVSGLLRSHQYQVLTATNGAEALQMIQGDPAIKLLIVDYNMPEMDGFELTRRLRREYEQRDLIIIGLSGYGSSHLSAKFIKNGANDFLMKPFFHEEFHCRVMHNVEAMENLEALREVASRDHLTDLYNRRYLFETGSMLYRQARKKQRPCTVALIDIDHFKRVNDTFGHEVGDQVIRAFAERLQERFGDYLVARFGGEEFCVVFPDTSLEEAAGLLESFRQETEVASLPIPDGDPLQMTVSIGATDALCSCFDDMMRRADVSLYASKEAGRNRLTTE